MSRIPPSSAHRAPRFPRARVFASWSGVLVIAMATACALPSGELPAPLAVVFQPGEIQRTDTPERTADGLVRVAMSNDVGAVLYLRPPDPALHRFGKLMLRPPEIAYARGVRSWGPAVEEQLRAFIVMDLERRLFESGRWQQSAVPGDDVLMVQPAAIELDVDVERLPIGSNFVYRAGGSALLVLDVRESVTNDALLRYGQRRPFRSGNFTGSDIDRERLKGAIREFGREVERRLPEFEEAAEKLALESRSASQPAR